MRISCSVPKKGKQLKTVWLHGSRQVYVCVCVPTLSKSLGILIEIN